jgi:DNA-binding MarR family transcriptional regulator
VDALDLYLLGRRLTKLGEAALEGPDAQRLPPAVALVLSDVMTHPESSISEITARTGFPQSYVSKSVHRLRQAGAAETVADPRDGRRTLVRPAASVGRRIADRAKTPLNDVLADAIDTSDAASVAEIQTALEVLVQRLVPQGARKRSASR